MPAADLKRVRIRMYRGILGDCFLLRADLEENGKRTVRSALIDCGVLHNVAAGSVMVTALPPDVVDSVGKDKLQKVVDGPTQIKKVATDLLAEVDNHLNLLIVTHEHYDHLSGFAFAKDAFMDNGVAIDRLWMAWTEDPADPTAKSLRARLGKGRQAISAAAALAGTLGADASESLLNASALAAFIGPPFGSAEMAAAGRSGTAEIMRMLKEKAGPSSTDYLRPGQVINLDAFGMRVFVLGPPLKVERLKKDKPSAGAAKEVYLTTSDAAAAAESTAITRLALSGGAPQDVGGRAELTPFSAVHLRPYEPRRKDGKSISPRHRSVEELYERQDASWRRIDDTWSESVESLALKMDSDTNNTSLALAFELPDGQVLLFPGDAQVGNWLSWNDQDYLVKSIGGEAATSYTAEDLLRRTTFYKVGHHASHNATAKALGLERMCDERLVAAIPVVEAVAAVQGKGRRAPGKGWQMPYGALYKVLNDRARGRVIRGDGDPAAERQAFMDFPTDARRPVGIAHANDGLWVELTIPL